VQKKFSDIWKIYPENALRGRTWHWWWWLFFFDNPDDLEYPKQLMILWGTRNCKKVKINEFLWEPKVPPEVEEGRAKFESVVASWYYDGKKMYEPFILCNGETETEWSEDQGSIKMENAEGRYMFYGRDADIRLKAENPDIAIDLRITKWLNELSTLVPSGKVFLGSLNMGYTMLKYRALSASGRIRRCGEVVDVKGRAYFQKVRISSITPSWYWATLQWDTGAYMQYTIYTVGVPMLRQGYAHRSGMNWGEKAVSKSINFYDPYEKKEYKIKNLQITKRYENDLPIFSISGKENGIEVSADLASYSRCCWNIRQPMVWPFWLGIFYNEYPARVLRFRFKNGSREYLKDDLGNCFCNCEHTWGAI